MFVLFISYFCLYIFFFLTKCKHSVLLKFLKPESSLLILYLYSFVFVFFLAVQPNLVFTSNLELYTSGNGRK